MKTQIQTDHFSKTALSAVLVDTFKPLLAGLATRYSFVRNLTDNPTKYAKTRRLQLKNAGKGALSREEIEHLRIFQETKVTSDHEKRSSLSFEKDNALSKPEHLTVYQSAAVLCKKLLENPDTGITSMGNVGARVDIVSSFLAALFPQISFYSIDFQTNLAEHNRLLKQSPNWKFASGYALDLFKARSVCPDLILFSSTMALIRHGELYEYLETLSKFCKYIAINDIWYLLRRPEQLPSDRPIVGGPFSNYHYNYEAIFRRFGFEVIESKIVEAQHKKSTNLLQLIAKNTLIS